MKTKQILILLMLLLGIVALSSCSNKKQVKFADGSQAMATLDEVEYNKGDTVLVSCSTSNYYIIDGSRRDTSYVSRLSDSTIFFVDRKLAVVVE